MSTDKQKTVVEVFGHRTVAGKRKGEVVDIDLTADQVRALIAGGHVRLVEARRVEKEKE